MPRKKGEKAKADASAQIGFRAPQALHDRLDAAAKKLGLDISGLLRMMILEKLPEYEERGRRLE